MLPIEPTLTLWSWAHSQPQWIESGPAFLYSFFWRLNLKETYQNYLKSRTQNFAHWSLQTQQTKSIMWLQGSVRWRTLLFFCFFFSEERGGQGRLVVWQYYMRTFWIRTPQKNCIVRKNLKNSFFHFVFVVTLSLSLFRRKPLSLVRLYTKDQ